MRHSFCFLGLFLLIACGETTPQGITSGKLIQTQVPPEFPFPLLTLDSIRGQEYVLLDTSRMLSFSGGDRDFEKRMVKLFNSQGTTSNSLRTIYAHQGNPDSLLEMYKGKRFKIVEFEPDSSPYGLNPFDLYIRVRFPDQQTVVLKILSQQLLGAGGQLIPACVLDSARRRWVGRYLWMNGTGYRTISPLARVKVMSIDAYHNFNGPYAFKIALDNGETETINCELQPQDTSFFSANFGDDFGNLFLEEPPNQSFATVPNGGLERSGRAFGEDSATFFKEMKDAGVRTQSYKRINSFSGADSIFGVQLFGDHILGLPLDSCFAIFKSRKLFQIIAFNMQGHAGIQDYLIKNFGTPSTDIVSHGSVQSVRESWLYYSSEHDLCSMLFTFTGVNPEERQKLQSYLPTLPDISILYYTDQGKVSLP